MTNDRTQSTQATPANDFPTESFDDPVAAVTRLSAIYEANTAFLRDAFARYRRNEHFTHRVRACYPFVRVRTELNTQIDSRRSYGFVAGPGIFETTLTRPDPSAPNAERAFHDYVYLRDNPAGPHREFWHHVSGCRSWLVVTRDTRDHAILTAEFAEPAR